MSTPSYVLRLEREGHPPTEVEFAKSTVTVGREAGDVVVGDPGASSRHAEILFADGVVKLRDVGSTNGTWRGTDKVQNETMQPGVKFTIGTSTLELVEVKGLEPEGGATMVMRAPGAMMSGPAGTEVQPGAPSPATEPKPAATPSKPAGPGALAQIGDKLRAAGQDLKKGFDALPADQKKKLAIGAGVGAIVLLLLFMLSGGSGRLTEPTEVTVKAVWFRGPAGPDASGGTSPSTVRISPNEKSGASVGILEEYSGGTGNQWRTATWLAAFSASQLSGNNLTDYEFLVRTGGRIDGPSAGMLMTATMLAILRGVDVRADTTMTGTINPDGSAGPVGGIVQKMDGASKDGIKRFGFPMGSRNHTDLRTGRTVDLFDKGEEFGLEVREIRDVFEAYEFLTGDVLPRPEAVTESEMELDSETANRLRNKNEKWTARVEAEIAGLKNAVRDIGQLAQRIQPLAAEADAAFARAKAFERSDFLGSAFESYVQAAVFAGMTKEAARFLKSASQNDLDAMVTQVQEAAAVKGLLSAMLGEAELQGKRETGGGQINTLRAYQSAVVADASVAVANGRFDTAAAILKAQQEGKASQQQVGQVPDLLFEAVTYFSIAKTMLDVAEDQQDFGTEEGQSPPIDLELIGRQAAAYGSAAGAVLGYLESLTIEGEAERAGVDKQTAKAQFAANDEDYLIAMRASNIAGVPREDANGNMLRLAAGSMAFLKGASLVNKYYSLGGRPDATGELVLSNRKALSAQLDLARQLAREAAAKAKQAVGFVPIASRMAYQLGVARREGSDEDKLMALEAFWEAAFWSELAANSAD